MSNVPISSLPLATSLSGSEFVPIVQGGTTKRTTVGQLINPGAIPVVTPEEFGYTTYGTGDAGPAINAAINSTTGPVRVEFGPHQYNIITPVVVTRDYVWLQGQGPGSVLYYTPNANNTAMLTWHNTSTVVPISFGRITDLMLISPDHTFVKTAINLIDVGDMEVGGLFFPVWSDATFSSVGLQTNGRQTSWFHDLRVFTDMPINILPNPHSGLAADHFHFENLYLSPANTRPAITATNMLFTNTTFDGFQAWVGNSHGFYYDAPTSAGRGTNLSFYNVRTENNPSAVQDASAYSFYMNVPNLIANVIIKGAKLDEGRQGIYGRGVLSLNVEEPDYPPVSPASMKFLDVDTSCPSVIVSGGRFESGVIQSLGALLTVDAERVPSSSPIPSTAQYAASFTRTIASSSIANSGNIASSTFNNVVLTAPASTAFLTLGSGKSVGIANSMSLSSTDGASVAFGAGGTVFYSGTAAAGDLAGTYPNPTLAVIPGLVASGGGSGTTTLTLTWDVKGRITTASSATITPAIGSITGLGANVATWLATPSSANLATAVTDETGSGALVFGTTPTLATPVINGLPTGTGVATANTASTLVARDGSGNFSAGTITAALSGNASTATAVPSSGLTGATLAAGVTASSLTSLGTIASLTATAIGSGTPGTGAFTTLSASTSITSPLLVGGSTASSTLTLESTSGAGTTDAIRFKTASQVDRMQIATGGQVNIGPNVAATASLTVNNNIVAPSSLSNTTLQLNSADGVSGQMLIDSYGTAKFGTIAFRSAEGIGSAFTATANGDPLGQIGFFGASANNTFVNTGGGAGGALIGANATENWSVTNQGTRLKFFVTPNGTAAINLAMVLQNTGQLSVGASTAIPAGGTAGTGLALSSTANFGIFFGSGVPTLSAAQGSLYLRSDGSSTSTRMYVNTNGTTGWTNVVTAT